MSHRPVILFAFANEYSSAGYLPSLNEEMNTLNNIFWGHDWFDIFFISNATVSEIIEKFRHPELLNRIVALHFAGHAESDHLLLKNGKTNTELFVKFLSKQKNLQLVFLNGCPTAGQIEELMKSKIDHIIATLRPVEDRKALTFATQFYSELAKEPDIEKAFEQATAMLKATFSEKSIVINQVRSLSWENKPDFEVSASAWKWFIRESEFRRISRKLRYSFILQQFLYGSSQYFQFLTGPNGRFRYVRITEDEAPSPQLQSGSKAKENYISTPLILYPHSQKEINDRSQQFVSLETCLSVLWSKEQQEGNLHTFLTGTGGAGKTLSMIRLWNKYLNDAEAASNREVPIPIFIPIDYLNKESQPLQKELIINKIIQQYLLVEPTEGIKKEFLTICDNRFSNNQPLFIFLIDGYDDLILDHRIDKRSLIQEMEALSQKKGIQLVISSRVPLKFKWAAKFHNLELQPLSEEDIRSHLSELEIPMPVFSELTNILHNPMMLNLYVAYADAKSHVSSNLTLAFKPNMESMGELFWNFTEAKLVNLIRAHNMSLNEIQPFRFILNHLLPYVAYQMEKEEVSELSPKAFHGHIDDFLTQFEDKDFASKFLFELYPAYVHSITYIKLGKIDFLSSLNRYLHILQICSEDLQFIMEESNLIRFSHRNFRDYFSALHILNEIFVAIHQRKIPHALRERPIPRNIRKLIGEIEGEHHLAPKWIASEQKWDVSRSHHTLLGSMLNLCRNKYVDTQLEFTIWNILSIWKEVRKDLSGLDLSALNLNGIDFNAIPCSRIQDGTHIPADFTNSKIDYNSFMPNGHTGAIYALCFLHMGKEFASGGSDKKVKIWSYDTEECLKTFEDHQGAVTALAYHPYDLKLLSGSSQGPVHLWSVDSGQCQLFEYHQGKITDLIWHPDGKWFLSVGKDGILVLWDPKGIEKPRIFSTESGKPLHSADVDLSLNWVVAGDNVGCLHIWDISTAEYIHKVQGHKAKVTQLRYHQERDLWLSASYDSSIKLWSIKSPAVKHEIKTFGPSESKICSLHWHPDGESFFVGTKDGYIQHWHSHRNEIIQTLQAHTSSVNAMAYFPSGAKFLSGGGDKHIKGWSLIKGRHTQDYSGHKNWIHAIRCLPDGKHVISGSSTGSIKLWNLATNMCEYTFSGHQKSVRALHYISKDQTILSASSDHSIKKWDLMNGLCMHTFEGHQQTVRAIDINAAQDRMVSVSDDLQILEWNIQSLQLLRNYNESSISAHSKEITSVLYHPGKSQIISAGMDDNICLWSTESGELKSVWDDHQSGVRTMACHWQNDLLLSADGEGTVRLWSLSRSQCLKTFQPHKSPIYALVFLPEDNIFLSASSDRTIVLSSLTTGEKIRTFRGHKHWVRSIAVHPNHKEFFSTGYDGTIKRWSLLQTEAIQTFHHIPGLWIQGCTFNHLHHESELSPLHAHHFRQHGARLEGFIYP